MVEITPDGIGDYKEFPEDPDLANFDPSDRKFVAVAIASGANPTIFNATDSDWQDAEAALKKYVTVQQLCGWT